MNRIFQLNSQYGKVSTDDQESASSKAFVHPMARIPDHGTTSPAATAIYRPAQATHSGGTVAPPTQYLAPPMQPPPMQPPPTQPPVPMLPPAPPMGNYQVYAVPSPAAPTNIYRPAEPYGNSNSAGTTALPGPPPTGSTLPSAPPMLPSIPPTPVPPTPVPPTPVPPVLIPPTPLSYGSSSPLMKLYGHIRDSTSAIWSEYDQWQEYIHPNGSLYWTCSAYPARVVSDIKPPLSNLHTTAPSMISRIMHALGEIPQIKDYHNWEIYTNGSTCVYIDHGSRAASDAFQSLEDFRDQVERLRGQMNIKSKLRLESAYWTFMQSHPNHRDLPDGAIDDATEAVVWCHADRALFKSSNAPFSQEDAREMTELMKTVADLNRPVLKTWYCAAILRAICMDRIASHYGQNDAREVRRREKAEDVGSDLPYNSPREKIIWHFVASLSLGAPLRYLKRINNVDRTQTGDGVNTLRWRVFLKSLCKEWTDSNLLATVLVSATVALLAIPDLNGMSRIAGVISALYALSSVLCGMLLISNHQDRVDSSGISGLSYFEKAKARGMGTTRPLAVVLSLPLSFMLWGMFWFVFAVVSCAYGPGLGGLSHKYVVAARYVSLVFLCGLGIAGAIVLVFFHEIWGTPKPVKQQLQIQPSTVNMVNEQGGNPLMQFSGDQRPEIPPTPLLPPGGESSGSYAYPLQGRQQSIPTELPLVPARLPGQTSLATTNTARPTGPVSSTDHPFSFGASPMAAVVSSRPPAATPYSSQNSPPGYSVAPTQSRKLTLTVADRKAWDSSLQDEAAYDKIVADVRRECEKYGQVEDLQISRPTQDSGSDGRVSGPGLGVLHVTFKSEGAAGNALKAFRNDGLLGYPVFGITSS